MSPSANSLRFLIDLGSTFTKVVAVDLESEEIVARAQAPSTVGTDVTIGLKEALRKVEADNNPENKLACSSAAGGLRMVAAGLVTDLSSKAATAAALGAGAKVIGTYSYELSQGEVAEIEDIYPDIILLAGGTDGGNRRVIVHNAEMLSKSRLAVPIIVAGNKEAQDEVKSLLVASGKHIKLAKNVMPEVNKLEVDSCREVIRRVFMANIVKAKGVERAKEMIKDIITPTPAAVLDALQLLADGCDGEEGWGECIAIDVGGATTDVHSIAKGLSAEGVIFRGLLPEPYAKRTVEGDLGVRYNLDVLVELGMKRGIIPEGSVANELVENFPTTDKLPSNDEEFTFDMLLARTAVEVAMERHVGRIELVYGPQGQTLVQSGKDLRGVRHIIGTGGPLVFAKDLEMILNGALFDEKVSNLLKPKNPEFYLDEHYILYAMGLLARSEPKKALVLMKKYLKRLN
jgi:uncharacterized protein (TIGR01319 family)